MSVSSLLSSATWSLRATRCAQLFGLPVRHLHANASVAVEERYIRDALDRMIQDNQEKNQQLVIEERSREECCGKLVSLVRQLKATHDRLENLLTKVLECKDGELRQAEQLLQLQRALASEQLLDVLKVKRLNNTLGLFERLQDMLEAKLPLKAQGVKGTALWEAIVSSDNDLMTCVSRCLGISPTPNNVNKVALNIYQVYSTLSAKVHDGVGLAELETLENGSLYFQKEPLSSQQADIVECVAGICGYSLKLCPRLMDYTRSSPSKAA